MYDLKVNRPAVLVHAGVVANITSPETGNFVPQGKDAPEGLFENNMWVSSIFVTC